MRSPGQQLAKYQEQPHLLDPFLAKMVGPSVSCVRDMIVSAFESDVTARNRAETASSDPWLALGDVVRNTRLHLLLEVLYTICSVRGSKIVGMYRRLSRP